MKTKLTLFATILAAALFGVGCASVQKKPLGMPPKGKVLSCKSGGGVVIPNSVDLLGEKAMTLALFCKPDGGGRVIHKRPFVEGSFSMVVGKDVVELEAWHQLGNQVGINHKIKHDNSQWVHVCWVFSSSIGTSRIYINGKLQSEKAETYGGVSLKGLTIAKRSNFHIAGPGTWANAQGGYSGMVDEVMVFDVALNAEQIVNLERGQKKKLPTGLIAYWNFDGGDAADLSGNGRDAELAGPAEIIRLKK